MRRHGSLLLNIWTILISNKIKKIRQGYSVCETEVLVIWYLTDKGNKYAKFVPVRGSFLDRLRVV